MVRRLVAALVILSFGGFSLLFAEGGLTGAFLDYGPYPRSLGMGKAFAAVSDDPQAVYFNPAGLFQLNAQQVLLAHSMLYGGMRMEYAGYALPTRDLGTVGLGILNYGGEGIDSRTPENWNYQPYVFAENAYLVSFAYNPWPFLGLGATAKLLSKNLAQYSDVGVGADVGILLQLPKPFCFGISIVNVVEPVLTLGNLPERYYRTVRLGAAVRLLDERLTVAADASTPVIPDIDSLGSPSRRYTPRPVPHGGVEFAIVPRTLIQRVGIDANELSVGLGVQKHWGKMSIGVDYAFLLHHASQYRLGFSTHKLGVFVSFGGFRVWIDAQPTIFSPTPDDQKNILWMDVRTVSRAPARRWQVLIKNGFGEVVRTYSGWDEPPLRMTWDGLDDAGRLVSDGNYYYEIVIVDRRNSSVGFTGFLTQVRSRGPQGRIEIRPGE
uniref:FlgD/Vpr Ig-like domain-containing protein n=1 Tax=candidate division WOR-3 bacterium TaxID=2052148 RepID=A0A7C4GHJ2_UNCW3